MNDPLDHWTAGHYNIPGNEDVDTEAKKAAEALKAQPLTPRFSQQFQEGE